MVDHAACAGGDALHAELLALRAELAAVRRGQALPGAVAIVALLTATAALLLPAACR